MTIKFTTGSVRFETIIWLWPNSVAKSGKWLAAAMKIACEDSVLVNNHETKQDYNERGGSTSEGDFGTILRQISEPATNAHVEWDHWTKLRGRAAEVFTPRFSGVARIGASTENMLRNFRLSTRASC